MYDTLRSAWRFGAIVVHAVWWVAVVGAATVFGTLYGWEFHGWGGAIALGMVGCIVGSMIAASPSLLLDFLAAAL